MPPLPLFTNRGILPTYVGDDPTSAAQRSPFAVEMGDLVHRFCTSPARARLLLGLNAYRRHLNSGGFNTGEQWVGGSFVEDCETRRGRDPRDIDVVTLFRRPIRYQAQPGMWENDVRNGLFNDYFSTKRMKPRFVCDTYPLDLDRPAEELVHRAAYWHGLLSETRSPSERKGIVRIPLMIDPAEYIAVDHLIRGLQHV